MAWLIIHRSIAIGLLWAMFSTCIARDVIALHSIFGFWLFGLAVDYLCAVTQRKGGEREEEREWERERLKTEFLSQSGA